MGWGIRGQYGHETGAMIAGLLVSAVLVLELGRRLPAFAAMRAIAMGTIAIGIGGSMTYGQTVGLTHDPAMVGNAAALRWGLLGLGIKGAIWIGFGGLFLGAGLGGVRYRWWEMAAILLGFGVLYGIGIWLLNRPFDPANRILPRIYFSATWDWQPNAVNLKPRKECWGGMLFALAGGLFWMGRVRRDVMALRLGLWGMLGGLIGFPLGQSIQAFHAWNLDLFKTGFGAQMDPVMNWWNWMETTFGFVMGGALGLGAWLNRERIQCLEMENQSILPGGLELGLVALHGILLMFEEFGSIEWINAFYDPGLVLAFLPLVGVMAGRWWPLWILFPITLLPIAGKTFRNLVIEQGKLDMAAGTGVFLILPIGIALWMLWTVGRRANRGVETVRLVRPTLLYGAWMYFGLNYAFFQFPWPWATWTARTPNALFYTIALAGLTYAVWRRRTEAEMVLKEN